MNKLSLAAIATVACLGTSAALADDTVICDGSATAKNGAVPASGTANTHFMVVAIAPKCSANVHLAGTDGTSGAWYAVGAVSVKGKNAFSGHTNGGAVAPTGTACAVPGGCTAAEAVTARGVANTAASST